MNTAKASGIMMFLFGLVTLAIVVLYAVPAQASGLPMATEWSWARDGGRIVNSVIFLSVVLWGIIKFGKPIFQKRAELIAERFDSLEKAREKAEKSLKDYMVKIKEMEVEAEKIRSEALTEGEMIKKNMIEQAEQVAKQIVEKASERIALEAHQAKEKLRKETTIAAINMAEEILKNNLGSDDQKRLVGEYLSKMENKN